MKLIITNDDSKIGVFRDFTDIIEGGVDKNGLLGQLIVELEIIKQELIEIYLDRRDEKWQAGKYFIS